MRTSYDLSNVDSRATESIQVSNAAGINVGHCLVEIHCLRRVFCLLAKYFYDIMPK